MTTSSRTQLRETARKPSFFPISGFHPFLGGDSCWNIARFSPTDRMAPPLPLPEQQRASGSGKLLPSPRFHRNRMTSASRHTPLASFQPPSLGSSSLSLIRTSSSSGPPGFLASRRNHSPDERREFLPSHPLSFAAVVPYPHLGIWGWSSFASFPSIHSLWHRLARRNIHCRRVGGASAAGRSWPHSFQLPPSPFAPFLELSSSISLPSFSC